MTNGKKEQEEVEMDIWKKQIALNEMLKSFDPNKQDEIDMMIFMSNSLCELTNELEHIHFCFNKAS